MYKLQFNSCYIQLHEIYSLLLHSPTQLHNAVHFRFAHTHLHRRVMQPVLHPHRNNSRQHLSASGIVVHTGVHPSLSLDHPQSAGFGSAHSAVSAWDQTWPAWYTALLTCCTSAFLVGGILAICKPRVKSVCLTAFTSLWFDVRSYIGMVNRSNSDSVSSETVVGQSRRAARASETFGKVAQVSHAVFLPFPCNAEVISHPVNEWKASNDRDFCGP